MSRWRASGVKVLAAAIIACDDTPHPIPDRHSSEGWRDGASGGDQSRAAPGMVLDDRLTIACATGAIRPTIVQRAGRGVTSADDLLRGFPIPAGTRLA